MKKAWFWFARIVVGLLCLPIFIAGFAIGTFITSGRIFLPVTKEQIAKMEFYAPHRGTQIYMNPEPFWRSQDQQLIFIEYLEFTREGSGISVRRFIVPWLSWKQKSDAPSPTAKDI